MSRSEDRQTAPQTDIPIDAPSPREMDLRRMEQQGYAVMTPFLALHAATENKVMKGAVKAAQLFLITFTFVTPVILMIAYS